MKTNHIENARVVGGDYFRLIYVRVSNKTLKSHLEKFNPDDYHILKATFKQRIVSYEDLLELKYSYYIFFKKELYDINKIMEWCDYLGEVTSIGIMYLSKPTPPFSPTKLIIKQ